MKAVICPKCGQNASDPKLIEDLFGYRKVPHPKPQSWCRACRNKQKRVAPSNPAPPLNLGAAFSGHLAIATGFSFEQLHRDELKAMYQSHYPGDKAGAKRSVNFMKARLKRKLAK